MSRRLEPQDLYAIQLVEDPQITPDGEQIAYVKAEIDRTTYEYHRNIWVTSASGTPGRRFTAGDNDTTPRWSPDGQSLAFLRRAAGEVKPKNEDERGHGVGKAQLWVLPADGGEARQLTWARYGVGDPEWSPDGAFIIYSAEVGEPDDREAEDAALHDKRVPAVRTIDRLWNRFDGKGWNYERRSHLFRIPRGGGDPEQLTDGDWDDGSPALLARWEADRLYLRPHRGALELARQRHLDPRGGLEAAHPANGRDGVRGITGLVPGWPSPRLHRIAAPPRRRLHGPDGRGGGQAGNRQTPDREVRADLCRHLHR